MTIASADPTSPLIIDGAQLIGDQWVPACNGQTIDVINPATGEVLGRVLVTGYGAEAGASIPAHPGIRRMSFTGSPATGASVMAACARNLTPLHLELGGKFP